MKAKTCAALDQAQFGRARPERVFVLHGHDRVDGVAAFQRVGADFGQAVAQDFAFLDKPLHGASKILGRDLRIVAVGVEEGDVVGSEAFQRAFEFGPQMFGPVVDAAGGVVGEGGLGGNVWALAGAFQPGTDDGL